MSNNNKEIYNQPITIKYSDDIELVQQVLNIYSKFVEYSLTPMYIDLMTYCIIDDMNSDDFKDNIIKCDNRFKNRRHIDAKMYELKRDGLLLKEDKAPRWRLAPEFQTIQNMIGKGDILLSLKFEK